MFKRLILLIIIFFTGCSNSKVIEKIIIKYVDTDISTPFRIKCNNFEDYFEKEIRILEINEKAELKEFNNFIDNLIFEEGPDNIDTRIKILIIFNNNSTKTVCINLAQIMVNGKNAKFNEKFSQYVDEIINNNE